MHFPPWPRNIKCVVTRNIQRVFCGIYLGNRWHKINEAKVALAKSMSSENTMVTNEILIYEYLWWW